MTKRAGCCSPHHQSRRNGIERGIAVDDWQFQIPATFRTLRVALCNGGVYVGALVNNAIGTEPHQRGLAAKSLDLPHYIDCKGGDVVGFGFCVGGPAKFKDPGVAQFMEQNRQPPPQRDSSANPESVGHPIAKPVAFSSLSINERSIRDPQTIGRWANLEDHAPTISQYPNRVQTKFVEM